MAAMLQLATCILLIALTSRHIESSVIGDERGYRASFASDNNYNDNSESSSDDDGSWRMKYPLVKPFSSRIHDVDDDDDASGIASSLPFLNKRTTQNRVAKKTKPLMSKGYTMDFSIESFKSERYCHYDETCKPRYKSYFECVCPRWTLCVGQGSLYEGKCSTNLGPYIWIQNVDDNFLKKFRF